VPFKKSPLVIVTIGLKELEDMEQIDVKPLFLAVFQEVMQ